MCSDVPTDGPPAPPAPSSPTGPALAQAALARARQAAQLRRLESERGDAARRRSAVRAANVPPRRSPDVGADGDPRSFGVAISELLAARGWTAEAAGAAVTADWERTVGAELAAHCRPVSLRDGVLHIEAESTAWATQLRLLGKPLLARIAELSGDGTVGRLVVSGPTGPSWTHGRLRVPGRGPRDTYG